MQTAKCLKAHSYVCRVSIYQNQIPLMVRRTVASRSTPADFAKTDNRRMLHAVYRVGNMEKALKFYKECLGMKLLRYREDKEAKYSNAFVGFGDERKYFSMELTENFGVDNYDLGDGFGHFGIAVEDVAAAVEKGRAAAIASGGEVTREPGPVKGGSTNIAFIKDPQGYPWEFIERSPGPNGITEPIAQVMLRVTDLDASIKWYQDVLGMKLLRKRDNEQYRYSLAFMGYGDSEDNETVFELTYNWPEEGKPPRTYSRGDAYAQVAIGTDDVFKSAEAIKAAGGKVTREPGPVPGIGTKIVATTDPDGWKVVLVDNEDLLAELE